MSSSSENRSPLARLVLFMIILSAAGIFAAGAHYYAIDLPEQKTLSSLPPENVNTDEKCNTCMSYCIYTPNFHECVLQRCELIC